jgi:hypothetical protein
MCGDYEHRHQPASVAPKPKKPVAQAASQKSPTKATPAPAKPSLFMTKNRTASTSIMQDADDKFVANVSGKAIRRVRRRDLVRKLLQLGYLPKS